MTFRPFKERFAFILRHIFLLFFVGHEQVLSIMTCVLEFVIGLCVIVGFMKKNLSIVYVAILSFFLWLTGINLFFPSLIGSIESCGCFGELIHFTPTTSFIKSFILWILSVVWFYLEFFGYRKQTLCFI